MNRRPLLVGLTIVVTGGLAGCSDTPERPVGDATNNDDDESAVVIAESRLLREAEGTEDERVWVEGIGKNVGERELSYVELRARFFDADDEQLDSTVEHIDDVTTSSRWPFEIEFPGIGEQAAQVTEYEIDVITTL